MIASKYFYFALGVLMFDYNAQGQMNGTFLSNNSNVIFENKGQVRDQFFNKREDVIYYGVKDNYSYYIKKDGISLQLYSDTEKIQPIDLMDNSLKLISKSVEVYRVDVNWIGINDRVDIRTRKTSPSFYGFYNVKEGISNVSSIESITFENIYNQINLIYYGKNGELKYDYVVQPGGNPENIKLNYNGADSVYVDDEGRLVIRTGFGVIFEPAPMVYQNNHKIDASWKVNGKVASFEIKEYDPQKILIIDPLIETWGTFFGGMGEESFSVIKEDVDGNVYAAGSTNSMSNIATIGSFQNTINGITDGVIVKFDKDGNRLWSTYFGGEGNESIESLNIDKFGDLVLVGLTDSYMNIATPGAHQETKNSGNDGFVLKFSENGSRIWGSYLGGELEDGLNCVSSDSDGNIIVCGYSNSSNGIASVGSFQTSFSGSTNYDGILAKFDANGIRLWGTYFGNIGYDEFSSVDVSENNYIVVVGRTGSTVGIASSGAFQPTYGGDFVDGMMAKFDMNGLRLWSTYYGGTGNDMFSSCVIDGYDNIYAHGVTRSQTNISSFGSYQPYLAGNGSTFDCMITKFGTNGNRIWASYYGGSEMDATEANGIDLFNDTAVCIIGYTYSSDHIATPDGFQNAIGSSQIEDGYLALFNLNGDLSYGTYLGGLENDAISGVSCSDNSIYVCGFSQGSTNIPTENCFKDSVDGLVDAFVIKFSIPIVINNEINTEIPNIMTSNNDNLNDLFIIDNLEENSEFTVLNRWGVEVYHSLNYSNDWSGDNLVEGVYYYILKTPSDKTYHGFFHLKK